MTLNVKLHRRAWLHGAAVGTGLWCAVLAFTASTPLLGQEPSLGRSSAEKRVWLADERQLPRQVERSTHRGYEISTGPLVVISLSSLEEARQAAAEAMQGWGETLAFADRLTSVHRQPNFAQGAVQIVLHNDPASQDGNSSIAVSPLGRVTQIIVSGRGDERNPDEPSRELRQAVAQALFRTAEIDQVLPDWVTLGLAAYVAGNKPIADDGDTATTRVHFLLEGHDGRHAGPFFDLLREQLADARPHSDRPHRTRQPGSALVSDAIDRYWDDLSASFEQWEVDPQVGQPQVAGVDAADESTQEALPGLLFALKLADRFADQESNSVRTRVTTFERGRRTATAVTHAARDRSPSLAALVDRMSLDPQPAWATIGPDGKLVWSDEIPLLRNLLGIDEQRYRYTLRDDKWVLETTLDDGRTLSGRLEPNPENEHRLLAKFSIVKTK